MKSDNWKKISEILSDCLEIDVSERQRYMDELRLSPAIRAELELFLNLETEAIDFMSETAVGINKDFFETDENSLIGQQIGVYKIVCELGFGGMGAVYLAQRTDGKFEQKVALKLLKREMNTAALRRRFQHEREILASLEHPNIARLLDAGTTGDKIPFIAMEYVEGLPIDVFCNKNEFDLNDRLDLFRKVCAAVNFAHRNLVVHRDLKPSNILVNEEGVPKLLDFGISKILSAEFEQINSATVTKLGVMTPGYASPEQLQSKSVTTATDIYSLGVILYELLSGHRPFETKESDLKEIYKAVLENEPVPPSALIADFGMRISDSESTSVPLPKKTHRQRIQTNPHSVIRKPQLKGDLDNIVLKALRKEPERRYSSAENLAEDIHRHQRGLPVTARPNTLSYRAEKFFKRNKGGVIGGVLIFLAIIGGIVATLWQARVAQAERAKAEKRFEDVRALANSFLFEFNPQIENLPGSLPARRLLVTRALEYLDNLSQEAGGDLQLQNELAKAYEKVGDVQGNPQTPNTGDLKGALQSYEKAQAIRRRLLENEPDNQEKQANLAANIEVAANLNLNGGEYDKAEAGFTEAVALREKVVAQTPKDVAARSNLGYAVRLSSYPPYYNSQNEKAMEISNRALAIFAELSREAPEDAFVNLQHANMFLDIGEGFAYLDNMPQAQENIRKGAEMLSALYEKHPNDTRVRRALWVSLLKRGGLLRDTGNVKSSLEDYDRALEISKIALQNEPGSFQAKRDVVLTNKQRAVTLKAAERFQEAVESFSRAIEISEQLKREDANNILVVYDMATSYQDMSELYFLLNDYQSTLSAAEKAQANCAEVLAKNPAHTQSKNITAKSKNLVGKAYLALAEKNSQPEAWKKALENLRASLEIYRQLKADGKVTPLDEKKITDLETLIVKTESKIGEK